MEMGQRLTRAVRRNTGWKGGCFETGDTIRKPLHDSACVAVWTRNMAARVGPCKQLSEDMGRLESGSVRDKNDFFLEFE